MVWMLFRINILFAFLTLSGLEKQFRWEIWLGVGWTTAWGVVALAARESGRHGGISPTNLPYPPFTQDITKTPLFSQTQAPTCRTRSIHPDPYLISFLSFSTDKHYNRKRPRRGRL